MRNTAWIEYGGWWQPEEELKGTHKDKEPCPQPSVRLYHLGLLRCWNSQWITGHLHLKADCWSLVCHQDFLPAAALGLGAERWSKSRWPCCYSYHMCAQHAQLLFVISYGWSDVIITAHLYCLFHPQNSWICQTTSCIHSTMMRRTKIDFINEHMVHSVSLVKVILNFICIMFLYCEKWVDSDSVPVELVLYNPHQLVLSSLQPSFNQLGGTSAPKH